MKKLLLGLLVSNFALAGTIVPIIKRNEVQLNDGALGAAWTKRAGHVGIDHNSYDDTTNFSAANYGEKFNFELEIDDSGDSADNTIQIGNAIQLGYRLSDSSVIAFDMEDDNEEYGDNSSGLAYGMKHSDNVYTGFGYKAVSEGEADSSQFYAGIGMYNDFDENKKSAKEIYLNIIQGEYDAALSSDEILDSKSLAFSWTEIINDYQFNVAFIYRISESEKNSYEATVTQILGELEKRITSNFFVEFSIASIGVDYDYDSGATANIDVTAFGANLRYRLAQSHQLIGSYIKSDENFGALYIDGAVTSVAYQYLW